MKTLPDTAVSGGKIRQVAVAALVLGPLLLSVAGCISSSSPSPPASNTTVVVPPSNRTTVICSDGSGPPCR